MKTKNIYTAKLNVDEELIRHFGSEKTGKIEMCSLHSKDVSWSTYFIVPDFASTDTVALDVLFDDDFRKENDVQTGDRFKVEFIGLSGLYEIEITGIEQGEPVNYLENKRQVNSTDGGKMEIVYRKLEEADLDTFISMRITQLREEGATEDIDLVPCLKDYYKRHMADGTFVSWLAVDGDKIIGTSGMSFVEKPPYFSCPTGRIGLLSSMFTDPSYRRMGIAKELLHRVVEEARAYGCGAVQITASDMGVKLYTAYGFKHNGNFMQYTF